MILRKAAFAILILLTACQQGPPKADLTEAISFYSALQLTLYSNESKPQQFLKEIQQALPKLQSKEDYKLEVSVLQSLLDSARISSFIRLGAVKQLEEVDSLVGLRDKCITYLQIVDETLNTECPFFLEALQMMEQERIQSGITILGEKFKQIDEAEEIYMLADVHFREKYKITEWR